jgi:Mlc titration factor MtfA (ptsG expression regulator)
MLGFTTRRRNRLRSQPFPASWPPILRQNVPYYERLSPADQLELQRSIQVFIAEKKFEGCGGLEMTDQIKVTIAAYACILLLHIEHHDYYPKLQSILVYPHAYLVPGAQRMMGNLVVEGDEYHAGESALSGTVVIAWDHLLRSTNDPGVDGNVALHEFAHQLDQEKGAATGAPILPQSSMYEGWARVLGREYEKLKEADADDRPTLLDKYGATNPEEFFAVATECFFEQPQGTETTTCGTL